MWQMTTRPQVGAGESKDLDGVVRSRLVAAGVYGNCKSGLPLCNGGRLKDLMLTVCKRPRATDLANDARFYNGVVHPDVDLIDHPGGKFLCACLCDAGG